MPEAVLTGDLRTGSSRDRSRYSQSVTIPPKKSPCSQKRTWAFRVDRESRDKSRHTAVVPSKYVNSRLANVNADSLLIHLGHWLQERTNG
jgi:hypothetical protein